MARKILLADDSVTAQNMGRKILADAGYDVVTVNNGSAALKRITEIKPDLIVLDVYMPGYSGLEVCQRLKDADETAHIPVLLTVGKLEPFKPEEARRVRADAHIVKPFEASELLTAITRLEDRMVPQQSDGTRFSSSVSGVERFGGDGGGRKTEGDSEADTGWKSRLRFPSKKKKEEPEPEPEDVAAAAPFRDFRGKGKGKTTGGVFAVKPPPPPGQEPGLVPDIPRDITPEELDALSALAAQLDGPIPAAEDLAQLAEKMGPVETAAAEIAPARTEPAKTEVEVPAAAAEAKQADASQEETKEAKTPAPPAVEIVAPPAAAALVVEEKTQRKREVEIPAGPAAEPVEVVATAAVTEIHQQPAEPSEIANPETPAAVVPVDPAVLAQQQAADKADEPRFASLASAGEQAAEEKVAQDRQTTELKPAAVAPVVKTEPTEAVASAEVVAAKSQESKPEESEAQAPRTKELKPEQPIAASASLQEAEEPAPSDADLVEALRLLTPATGQVEVSTIPSHGTLVAAGQLLAEEAARNASTGSRWMAEAVTLSSEEAAISLEAEMFRTFATMPAVALGSEPGPVRGISAITAAVENRLAAAELAAGAKTLPEQEAEHASAEHGSSKHVSETTAGEQLAVIAPSEVLAAASNAANPVVDEITPAITAEKIAPAKLEVEQKDSVAKIAEAMPAEEVALATFADAVGKDEAEVEPTAEQNGEQVGGTKAAVAEENQDSNSDSGGEEAMGKDEKTKSGKSNWHQIHAAPANAAAQSDVVEAAKQAQQGTEDSPKAMAAAAAADGSKAAFPTDASSIASIVDSVMADLRPKIVEEIARKLAGK
ncbi:MAG TPA: response regulator [Terriglobales bacterium]